MGGGGCVWNRPYFGLASSNQTYVEIQARDAETKGTAASRKTEQLVFVCGSEKYIFPHSNLDRLTKAGSIVSWCMGRRGNGRLQDSLASLACPVYLDTGGIHGHCLVQKSGYHRCQPFELRRHLRG